MSDHVDKVEKSTGTNGISNSLLGNSLTNLAKKLYGMPNKRGGTTWLDKCPEYLEASSRSPDHALDIRHKEARPGAARQHLLDPHPKFIS